MESSGNAKPLPCPGRLLGVDFGTVRIGLAISDFEQRLSSPLDVYHRQSNVRMAQYFRELVVAERIIGVIVGLPVHASGHASEKSREATQFARGLMATTQLPVVLYDERFTTALARDLLSQSNLSGKKRKERLDKIAAHVLLSSYFEAPDRAIALDDSAEGAIKTSSLDDSGDQV
ncbi:MAG: Holliday junction resolvase RuvX [Planctomycetaceae bacterium]|nr:Holliday junction resolvase RuvX [Planctomycetaceae bacterium]